MKKIILSAIIILTLTSTLHAQPFPKKKNWYGVGFIYSDPQRELDFGKWHRVGYEGNFYYRTVLNKNIEFGVGVDLGIYKFDVDKFRRAKELHLVGEEKNRYNKKDGYMLSIYQDIFMNALPKFSKDFFFSFGLGLYWLRSDEGLYESWQTAAPGWNPIPIRKIDIKAPGFNIGFNYDHTLIYNKLKFVLGVRYHQLMFAEDLQNFLKITTGFMF